MVHQLTSLAARGGEAQTVHDVVESALDQAQKNFAGVAVHSLCLFVVHSELLFQDAVDKLDLLLLGQLRAILGLLGSSLAAGVAVGLLAVTHCSGRYAQRSATL